MIPCCQAKEQGKNIVEIKLIAVRNEIATLTMESVGSTQQQQHLPELFLLLENCSKGNNLGSILRCASAFGITTIVAIGFSKCSVQGMST